MMSWIRSQAEQRGNGRKPDKMKRKPAALHGGRTKLSPLLGQMSHLWLCTLYQEWSLLQKTDKKNTETLNYLENLSIKQNDC